MVTFARIGASRLYVPTSHSADVVHSRIGFVSAPGTSLGPTVDPSAAFAHGTIILLPTLQGISTEAFARVATEAFEAEDRRDVRLALFTSRGDLRATQLVRADATGRVTQYVRLQLGVKDGQDGPSGSGYWRAPIPKGTTLRGIGHAIEICFAEDVQGVGLQLDKDDNLAPLATGHRRIVLELDGLSRGIARFSIDVNRELSERLGIGMRYFRLKEAPGANVIAHAYPLYDYERSAQFEFALDFAAPYEEEKLSDGTRVPRSMLRAPAYPLTTNLHALHGHRVTLRPEHGHSHVGFRLAKSPLVLRSAGAGGVRALAINHYLTPYGRFELGSLSGPKSFRLSLGPSNLETLRLNPNAGDRWVFELGAALVADASSAKALGATGDLDDASGHCLTAWVRMEQGQGLNQERPLAIDPEGMPGYQSDGSPAMDFDPTRFSSPTKSFPLVPLLGLKSSSASGATGSECLQLERSVLAHARRTRILPPETILLSSALHAASVRAHTPHGYVLERPGLGAACSSVLLGRTARRARLEGSAFQDALAVSFGLTPATAAAARELAALLARNRLFLVTTPKRLIEHGFDAAHLQQICMAGWTAETRSDAIIVLKHEDRAAAELLGDVRNWTMQDELGTDVAFVRDEIERALARRGELYEPLRRRWADPHWNGLLIFNATLPAEGLPDQLAALSAALHTLVIHHVGIDLSAIVPVDSGKAWPTAVFGVLDHDGTHDPFRDSHAGLSMRVARLSLRVDNDALERFECTLQLKIRALFDVDCENVDDILKLEGRYESRVDEDGRRQESYNFIARGETKPIYEKTFRSTSLLRQVSFRQVQMLTKVEDGAKRGCFLIDGSIAFNQIGKLDLLGLDKLDFSGFGVDFDIDSFTVDFDYPSLRFDLDGFNRDASKRAGSLLAKLPLKLRGFRVGDMSLPSLGFFSFGSIDLPGHIKAADEFKFGFDFDLDLGSLGALAKKLERFRMQVLLGWKPIDKLGLESHLAIGFRLDLGEGAGGIDLGLQGILRLTAEQFHLRKEDAPVDGGAMIILSAEDCVLEVLGQRLPTQKDQHFSLFLFASLGREVSERPGWYASFVDASPRPPIAVKSVTLGQRVNVRFGDLTTTRGALEWLDHQVPMHDVKAFVQFAAEGGALHYDANREWFIAMRGELFEVARFALLLRDPDLYGAYVGLLGPNPDGPAVFELDLLYEKLGEGVGRYSVEVVPPPNCRTFDVGAVALTISAIRAELYTDGGFLVDLGFPKHVDYSRSFVIQGGPFIGKGGFYIGRVPREAVPLLANAQVGKAFRAGIALRFGLGREVERGPIRAGLSVSLFGRVEGAIARSLDRDSYHVALHGEVGLIAELEGSVDLKLVRARLFVRLWLATGIALVTGQPVLLYCEAGVRVSVEVIIGRIKIFRKTIKISVRLSYSTTLRFEWVLPVRIGPTATSSTKRLAFGSGAWTLPDFRRIGVSPAPFQLRMAFDVTRATDGAGRCAVLVPSLFWLVGDGPNGDRPPFAELGRALVGWAALRRVPTAMHADSIVLAKTRPKTPDSGNEHIITLAELRGELGSFDAVSPEVLDAFFGVLFSASRLEFVEDGVEAVGYPIPVPPLLRLRVGGKVVDLGAIGLVRDDELAKMLAHIDRQFAELDPIPAPANIRANSELPLNTRIFRDWCQLFALIVLDAVGEAFDAQDDAQATVEFGKVWDRIKPRWPDIVGRAGRLLHGGLRVASSGAFEPLLARAGLQLEIPPGRDTEVAFDGIGGSGWLGLGEGVLAIDGRAVARVSEADVPIDWTPTLAPALRVLARSFVQSPFARLTSLGNKSPTALLAELSSDLRSQLLLSTSGYFPSDLVFLGRVPPKAAGQKELRETPLRRAPVRALVFDMAIERIAAASQADGTPVFLPHGFQVAGASEAERRALDGLLRDQASAVAALVGARVSLAWRERDNDGPVLLSTADASVGQVMLARSTVSVERRPFEAGSLLIDVPEPEDTFRATMTPANCHAFLSLLQRAAIVNSGGTYLLVPAAIGNALASLFNTVGERARLSVIVAYPEDAQVPSVAVNAVIIEDADDRALLDPNGGDPRVLAVRSLADPADMLSTAPGLVEAVGLRPPGAEMVRVWRKPPAATAASDEGEMGAHLAGLFDMLEFEVRAEDGTILLSFDESLPLASESAVADGMPDQIKAWLREEASTAGYTEDDFLRYDLLLPLSRVAARGEDSPYAGVGRRFTVRLDWRDIYGNRLHGPARSITIPLSYRDPLVPVGAWPAVEVWVVPGAPTSETFELRVDAPTRPANLASEDVAVTGRELRRVIDQLSGPGISVRIQSKFGELHGDLLSVSDLRRYLQDVLANLVGGAKPSAFRHRFRATLRQDRPFLPLLIELIVERSPDLVSSSECAPGVARTCEPLRLRARAACVDKAALPDEVQQIATAFLDSFTPSGGEPSFWAARGTDEAGESTWWAVSSRLIPTRGDAKPSAFAPPPLARSALSARAIPVPLMRRVNEQADYRDNNFDQSEERQDASIDALDLDADVLMEHFLSRVDSFLSPINAPVTAQCTGLVASTSPFERVVRAKAAMLGRRVGELPPLLSQTQPVRTIDGGAAALDEAVKTLREACAAELERFYKVGSVLVQPLASQIPTGWFKKEPRPKLFGRVRFGSAEDKKLGFRVLTRGIELREESMYLALAVLPEAKDASVDLSAHGAVHYEITHVERLIEMVAGESRLAPSQWLSLVPVLSDGSGRPPLPIVEVSAGPGDRLVAPLPRRHVPAVPMLKTPTLSAYQGDPPPLDYESQILAARRYSFSFEAAAELAETDELCGRLIYNASNVDAPTPTATPAAPLFPHLFERLVAFEARVAPYWSSIVGEANRLTSEVDFSDSDQRRRFNNACERFAEAVEDVATKLVERPAHLTSVEASEDRFIVTDARQKDGRRTRIEFRDHLSDDNRPWSVNAGEGRPSLVIRQVLGEKILNAIVSRRFPEPVTEEFDFETSDSGGVAHRLVEIGRLDAMRMQSVWVAASVRRNARLGEHTWASPGSTEAGKPDYQANPSFIYRTPEVYLQEILVPNLLPRQTFEYARTMSEPLRERLVKVLSPIFAGAARSVPVQVRFDYESGQMTRLLETMRVPREPTLVPEPDPKLQIVGIELGENPGNWSLSRLADEAAQRLRTRFAKEPLAAGSLRGRLIVGVTVRSSHGVGQPLLRLQRIVVPLEDVSDLDLP